MKLQNLNELRYIIEVFQDIDKQNSWYFVGKWPGNHKIRQLIQDGNTAIDIYDHIYYSPIITDAKIYNNITDARNASTQVSNTLTIRSCKVKAVSAKIFFKANLKGIYNGI